MEDVFPVVMTKRSDGLTSVESLFSAYKERIARLEKDKLKLTEARNKAESVSFEQCKRVDDLTRELGNNESFAKSLMTCLEELKDTVDKQDCDFQQEVSRTRKHVSSLQEQIQELQESNQEKDTIICVRSTVEEINQSLLEKKLDIQRLEKDVEELNSKRECLQRDLNEVRSTAAKQAEAIDQEEACILSARTCLSSLFPLDSEPASFLELVKQVCEVATIERDGNLQKVKQLEDALQKKEITQTSLEDQLLQSQSQIFSLMNECKRQKGENERLSSTLNDERSDQEVNKNMFQEYTAFVFERAKQVCSIEQYDGSLEQLLEELGRFHHAQFVEINFLHSVVEDLNGKLNSLEQGNVTLEAKLEESENIRNQISSQLHEFEEHMKIQEEHWIKEQSTFQTEIQTRDQNISGLESRIASDTETIKVLQERRESEVKDLQEKIKSLEESLLQKEGEVQVLIESNLQEQQEREEELESQKENARSVMEQLKKSLEQVKEDLRKVTEQRDSTATTLSKMQENMKQSELCRSDLEVCVLTLRGQVNALQKDNESKLAEISSFKHDLDVMSKQLKAAMEGEASVKKEMEQLQDKLASCTIELHDTKSQRDLAEQKLHSAEERYLKEHKNAEALMKSMKEQMEKTSSELETMKNKNSSIMKQAESRVKTLEERLKQTEAELKSSKTSKEEKEEEEPPPRKRRAPAPTQQQQPPGPSTREISPAMSRLFLRTVTRRKSNQGPQ